MNPLVRVGLAAAGGTFLSEYLQPHLDKVFKPESDFAKKAAKAGSAAASAVAVYWALGKV